MNKSESIGELTKALAKAQGIMLGAVKDASNPHFKSKYATLENVIDAIRAPLTENGIAFMQAPTFSPETKCVNVTTTLYHGEQWISSSITVPVQQASAQGVGSAITYACRYSLQAIVGLPPVDDDGEASIDRSDPPKQQNTKSETNKENPAVDMDKLKNSFAAMKEMIVKSKTLEDLEKAMKRVQVSEQYKAGPPAWQAALIKEHDDVYNILEVGFKLKDNDDFPGDMKVSAKDYIAQNFPDNGEA